MAINLKAIFSADTSSVKKGAKEAKQAIKDFEKDSGEVLNDFKGLFSDTFGALGSQAGVLKSGLSVVTASIKAATAGTTGLSAAMKILKIAVASTGIGAIVIALIALITYFKKNTEGSEKLAVALAPLKLLFAKLGDVVMWFGETLAKGIEKAVGWIGKLVAKTKEFFGITTKENTQLKQDLKESQSLAKRENQLRRDRVVFIRTEADLQARIAALRLKAKDEESGNAEERLSALMSAKQLEEQLANERLRLAREEYNILVAKNSLSYSNLEDIEKENELYAQIRKIEQERDNHLREYTEQHKTLLAQIEEEKKAQKVLNSRQQLTSFPLPDFSPQANQINATVKSMRKIGVEAKKLKSYFGGVEFVFGNTDDLKVEFEGVKDQYASFAEFVIAKNKEVQQSISDSIVMAISESLENLAFTIGESLGTILAGTSTFKDFGAAVIGVMADLAITVGKIAISVGIATLGIKAALESLNGYVAIAAGVALVALGTWAKSAMSAAASPGSAAGSASSYSTTAGKQSYSLMDTMSNTTKAQDINVNVTGTLKAQGNTLVAVINSENKRKNITT